ncbi:MAG: phosphopantothenate/pantothenate synthetase [Nitrosopumilus sp. B06]|nr:MAG: phosphopantothenate/pantothenate synthetase [Nitrosopumilus sp. D6]RNJ79500.1 MAG: phosphopantothenate/pantothenate synthetase [Nitrosopumilus sp. B06]
MWEPEFLTTRHVIPRSHPRVESLLIRKKLVDGFDSGLVAREGLLAQGRGEAFDYLLGEKTGRPARRAIRAAAATLTLAEFPVISVNGNAAALCAAELVSLSMQAGAKLEVNLFYASKKREQAIVRTLRKCGAQKVLGTSPASSARLQGMDSARRMVDRDGILAADVVVVPLEDGDRTAALKSAGKTVIAFDLNPLSRTAQTAHITIVDNITRAAGLLAADIQKIAGKNAKVLHQIVSEFDNRSNLADSIAQIRGNLARRGGLA